MFSGFNQTVIGVSHLDEGKVCQDYSEYIAEENFSAAIVADGHGSKKHFRSDVGSKFAVEATASTLREFLRNMEEFEQCFTDDPAKVIKKIQKHIIICWNKAITEYHESNPVTEAEKNSFTEEQFNAIKCESIYGTTLIAGVMCEKFSFGIQIGDGSLVTLNEYAVAEMPIADDETCPANLTASICNTNAIEFFNSFYTFKPLMAMFVSTDGLFTSFGSRNDFEDYHTILAGMLDDMASFKSAINKNLEKRTHHGTQDDISLAGVFEKDFVASSQGAILNQIELNRKMAEIRKAEHKAKLEKQKAKAAMLKEKYEMEAI